MTVSASSNTNPPIGAGSDADVSAVLVLDTRSRVAAANAHALRLWSRPESELIGAAFASLFVFEVFSNDADFLEAQWEVLLSSTQRQDVFLNIADASGNPREVRVRLEKLLGADGYVATVQPFATPKAVAAALSHENEMAMFRLLEENAAAGFFDLNLANGKVHFSPSWKKLLGYTAAELPDTVDTWHALIHPDDSAAAPDKLSRKFTAGSRPFSVEFRMRHQLGHWVWIQCVGVQVMNARGELERVIGLQLDISERKELEDTFAANDARLQDLSGSGPLAAFEMDFANGLFWFSPAWERLLGYREGELVATPESFATALPLEEAAMGVEPRLLSRTPGQTAFSEVVRLRDKKGQAVTVLLGLHRSVTRKRELQRVVGFACALPADAVTPADALSWDLATAALGTLAEAVIVADAHAKIAFLNATAARLLRVDAAAARGQPVGDVLRLVKRLGGRPSDDPIDRALTADQPLSLISDDALAPANDASPATPIVWTARVAAGTDSRPRGVVIVFRNPDEMTLTPEELVKANRFESLGLLAGGIAHDFNNLLTTILGGISVANDNRDYSALADSEKACLAAKDLTRQLLTFAKGGAGSQTVCASKTILEDSIKLASAASAAAIALEVAEDTQPVLVERAQILQVFQNLIVNALQAMPPPPHRPRLHVRAGNIALAENQVPALAAGDYVEFEVRDNGSGIQPEHVAKIFDPFFTTKKHGTGLGLATVLSIVRKHGGQIGLDTQVGVGTAFTVYLPKADRPVDVQARRAASLRFGTGRVLFMDDDPRITQLTGTMLQSLDYKFDVAKDGAEAIALYKRYQNIGRPYDAVILDLTIVGGMGGEECFLELLKLDPEVRAILASGYDNEDIARKYLQLGFCGYLPKPYRVTELGKVLKAVLG